MKLFDRRRFLKMLGIGTAAAPIAAAELRAPAGLGDYPLAHMPPPAPVAPTSPPVLPDLPKRYPTPPNGSGRALDYMRFTDRRPWSLYCRQRSPAGAMSHATYTFFNDPLSPTRDLGDTNMRRHGCLPIPQKFLIQKVFFLFCPTMTASDRDAMMDSYYFRLSVDSKCIAEGPLARFPNVVDLRMVNRPYDPTARSTQEINAGAPIADAYISVARTREEIAAAIELADDDMPATSGAFANCYEHCEPIGIKTRVPLGKYAPFKVDLSSHPYVVQPGASLLVEVIGEPFSMDPAGRGTGANFFAVLDGIMDFPIQ